MKKYKTYLYNYWDIILFFILMLTKLLTYGNKLQLNHFKYNRILYPSIASILLIIALSFIFKRKSRFIFLILFNILISITIIGDLNYFRYFKDLFSLSVLINSFQLGSVGSSVLELFNLWDLVYILDILILIPFFFVLKKKGVFCEDNYKFHYKLIIIPLIIAIPIEFISFYKLSQEQPRLISTMYNKVYIAEKLGVLNYHYIDFYSSSTNFIKRKIPVSANKKESIKNVLAQKDTSYNSSKYKGIYENKNVILIQIEALQNFVINKEINNKEITPNLNKFLKKSLYFNNYFYQIASGSTSDAEFITNNSLYPASSGAAYFLYAGNHFNSLPSKLKEKGYNTSVFHGYKETFWNRNLMYKNMNIDKFYSEKDYKIDEKIGLGLSDKCFLNETVEKMKKLKEPYFSFIITLTSHFPYDATDKYGEFDVGEYEGTLLGNYMKSIHYTDDQLGVFLDKLEKENILDNSIIAIYGDHYAIPRENEKDLSNFLGKDIDELNWIELQKVPLIIHTPDEKLKGVENGYCGQIDLYPTLANLLNIKNNVMFGRDLLNNKDKSVIFRNGSFTDGKVFYISPVNSYYDIKTHNKISETEELKTKKDNVVSELNSSDNILKHDLLKNNKLN
ncbi:alkaline phosphatase [Clostridium botulinum]|uniref:LTA synthase family protein n=1 Tax=Clostridium botulinum TaxID=1491 RepID=A0ABD7CHD3_CLOBO|nr:LTA synthase family protein [Clostridium botulinum]KGO12335.1 alkaline phosphatase [Clostridium botulinum]QRI52770.1 LTA synthase family protein [Clostridium botulinum]